MEFNKAYNREEYLSFLRVNFLPDDFQQEISSVENPIHIQYTQQVTRLGECESLGLVVYEVRHNSKHDARVGLTKEAFRLLADEFCERALVLFVPEDDNSNYRFSLIEITLEQKDDSTKVKRNYSNPHRYSYYLGKGIAYYTPNKYLNEYGRVVNVEDLRNRFSVEALTKQFYQDLYEWYQWAVDPDMGITFPNDTSIEEDDREDIDIKIIRLITRLMFVWFIKQKGLVPDRIFDTDFLSTILRDFDAQSASNGIFYNAILQNLFFATLNRAITDEDGNQRKFAKASKRDIKTLYRYAELFCISEEEVVSLFAEVPFLNGGLFECLDKTRYIDGVEVAYNLDGFSRNDMRFADGRYKHRAVIPNILFFEPQRGLISILSRYNFTIEENSPEEQQVALDPELLGKVFENLLGAYNPETKETARNQSGSFYTPREIVNYMVDESLIAYLGDSSFVRSIFHPDFVPDELRWSDYQMISGKLKSVKVFDPACGSGAFPMGLLNRIVDVLQKIDTDTTTYDLKLKIIENCLYGCDIQSIAAQITKLRFFISLICDCERDPSKPNFGIPTLPNLETKFVTANTLIARKNKGKEVQGNLFVDSQINEIKQQLRNCRHQHFNASSAAKKVRLRKQDEELRGKLTELLSEGFESQLGAEQLAAWNPYDQNAVSPFFDSEWMFGITDGFDIVIGNPPYIQLQNNGGELARLYQDCHFKTFARTGDIYCLFYERGWQLLKNGGHLCFITSNKWMRAGYGEKTREFFADETNPIQLIDFAGVKIFESATVDTNILLFSKSANQHKTICAVTSKENKDSVKNLSDFVQQQNAVCQFSSSDAWVILSPIEQSIKRKIEAVGTPLKDWNINIYRGVLTGYNDAFIISTEKRNEILANCQTEDERQRTAELIRPILRGRDIKRYGYDWANLWLIYIPWHFPYQFDDSIQGASEKAEKAFKEQYPAVYSHMLQYKEPLSKRNKAETGIRYEWYAMQRWGAKYWDDFSKQQIVWIELSDEPKFAFAENVTSVNTVFFMTGEHILHLLGLLNSKLISWYFRHCIGTTSGVGTNRWLKYTIEQIPMAPTSVDLEIMAKEICQHYSKDKDNKIDLLVCHLYDLNSEEINYISSL